MSVTWACESVGTSSAAADVSAAIRVRHGMDASFLFQFVFRTGRGHGSGAAVPQSFVTNGVCAPRVHTVTTGALMVACTGGKIPPSYRPVTNFALGDFSWLSFPCANCSTTP